MIVNDSTINTLSDAEKYALEYFLEVLERRLIDDISYEYSLKDSPEMRELSVRASKYVYDGLNMSMVDVLNQIREKPYMGGCYVNGEHMIKYLIKRLREVGILRKDPIQI